MAPHQYVVPYCQACDDLDMHWAADMALRLLQARHASRQQASSSSSSSSSEPAFWVPWVDSLPQRVVTPVEFTAQEVQQLVIPSTIQVGCQGRACCHTLHLQCSATINKVRAPGLLQPLRLG
jgi:hypothetical protein